MSSHMAFPEGVTAQFFPSTLFDMTKTEHAALFSSIRYIWEVLPLIGPYLEGLLKSLHGHAINSLIPDGAMISKDVYIGYDCQIDPGVYIKGPAWIGDGCILRQGLFIKGSVIAEKGSFLGHASELKNCFLFAQAETPHFNYVGDSILGFKTHLGAGVILSNVRLDKAAIPIQDGVYRAETGLYKMGAFIGDGAQIGCNSVLNPGTIIGKNAVVFPLSRCRGIIESGAVIKESSF